MGGEAGPQARTPENLPVAESHEKTPPHRVPGDLEFPLLVIPVALQRLDEEDRLEIVKGNVNVPRCSGTEFPDDGEGVAAGGKIRRRPLDDPAVDVSRNDILFQSGSGPPWLLIREDSQIEWKKSTYKAG